jgi:hypothetical protein
VEAERDALLAAEQTKAPVPQGEGAAARNTCRCHDGRELSVYHKASVAMERIPQGRGNDATE